jgi:hypothetical protein
MNAIHRKQLLSRFPSVTEMAQAKLEKAETTTNASPNMKSTVTARRESKVLHSLLKCANSIIQALGRYSEEYYLQVSHAIETKNPETLDHANKKDLHTSSNSDARSFPN